MEWYQFCERHGSFGLRKGEPFSKQLGSTKLATHNNIFLVSDLQYSVFPFPRKELAYLQEETEITVRGRKVVQRGLKQFLRETACFEGAQNHTDFMAGLWCDQTAPFETTWLNQKDFLTTDRGPYVSLASPF